MWDLAKKAFWLGLIIWLGGGAFGKIIGNEVVEEICINIFGLLTIGLGLVLAVRWVMNKFAAPSSEAASEIHSPQQAAMSIYSATGVNRAVADVCERAIQNDFFSSLGKEEGGREFLHITTPEQDYVAVVEIQTTPPFGDAIILCAAYAVEKGKAREFVNDLMELS